MAESFQKELSSKELEILGLRNFTSEQITTIREIFKLLNKDQKNLHVFSELLKTDYFSLVLKILPDSLRLIPTNPNLALNVTARLSEQNSDIIGRTIISKKFIQEVIKIAAYLDSEFTKGNLSYSPIMEKSFSALFNFGIFSNNIEAFWKLDQLTRNSDPISRPHILSSGIHLFSYIDHSILFNTFEQVLSTSKCSNQEEFGLTIALTLKAIQTNFLIENLSEKEIKKIHQITSQFGKTAGAFAKIILNSPLDFESIESIVKKISPNAKPEANSDLNYYSLAVDFAKKNAISTDPEVILNLAFGFSYLNSMKIQKLFISMGLVHFFRYPQSIVEATYSALFERKKFNKSILYVTYGFADYNGFMYNRANIEKLSKNYLIIISENSRKDLFYDRIDVVAKVLGKIDSMAVFAHGEMLRILLGGSDSLHSLDFSDKEEMEKRRNSFIEKPKFFFVSCHTGFNEQAIAAFFSSIFAAMTFAPKKATFLRQFLTDDSGFLIGMDFDQGETAIYSKIRPKKLN